MPACARAGWRERRSASTKASPCGRSPGRRGRSVTDRGARGAEQWTWPVSLTPIRFALPITALRDGAPSAAAMALALFPSSANRLRVLDCRIGPHVPRPPLLPWQFNLVKNVASPAPRADVRLNSVRSIIVTGCPPGCISWLIQPNVASGNSEFVRICHGGRRSESSRRAAPRIAHAALSSAADLERRLAQGTRRLIKENWTNRGARRHCSRQ